MAKNIMEKIDGLTTLTPSQEDRLNTPEHAVEILRDFLNSYTLRVSSKNELNNKIDKLILDKIEKELGDEENIDNINWGVIMKLKELVGKQEIEASTPILKIMENAIKQPDSFIISKNKSEEIKEDKEKISNDDYKSLVKLSKFINDLKETEFNEKENI